MAERIGILVAGMHRSGTSALTRMLGALGCDLPRTLMPPDAHNERGYWESQHLADLNDELLAAANSSWDDWAPFDERWYASSTALGFRVRATEMFEAEFGGSGLFVLKDPRVCRLLPFWTGVLAESDCEPRTVLPIRNPDEVAASLMQRDGIPVPMGHLIWLRNVLAAEHASRDYPRVFVRFADLLTDWRAVAETVGAALDIPWPQSPDAVDVQVQASLSEAARHHRHQDDAIFHNRAIPRWIRSAFEILDGWAHGAPADAGWKELDAIRSVFDEAGAAFAATKDVAAAQEERIEALQRSTEDRGREVDDLAATIAAKDRQIESLDKAIGERDVRIDALNHQIAARDGQIQTANGAIAERDARMDALVERAAERDTEMLAVQATLAGRDSRLEHLGQQIEARGAEISSLQHELAERDQKVADLATRASAQGGQIESLDKAVAERDVRIDALNHQVAARDGQVQGLNKTINERDQQIGQLGQQVADGRQLAEEVSAQSRQIESLDKAVSERDVRIDALNHQVAARDGQIQGLNKTVNERDQQIGRLDQQVADGRQLAEKVSAQSRQIESLDRAVAERDVRVDALHHQVAARDGRIHSINQTIAERDASIANLNRSVAERDGWVASLEQRIADRDRKVDSLSQQTAERARRIGKLDEELAQRNDSIESLSHTLAEGSARIGALDREIENLNALAGERQGRIQALEQETLGRHQTIEDLSRQLAERSDEVETANSAATELEARVHALETSTSWRVTAPLRGTKYALVWLWRGLRLVVGAILYYPLRLLWRMIPLGASRRERIRNAILRRFGREPQPSSTRRYLASGRLDLADLNFEAANNSAPTPILFDSAYYLAENPDVEEAGIDPLEHYLQHGATENRMPFDIDPEEVDPVVNALHRLDLASDDAARFDPDFYRLLYPDLATLDDERAAEHYKRHGSAEARIGTMGEFVKGLCESPREIPLDFKAADYLDLYPDLSVFAERSPLDALRHYMQSGRTEPRLHTLRPDASPPMESKAPLALELPDGIRSEAPPLCVLAHVFYPELWDELADYLANLPADAYHLYVNLVDTTFSQELLGRVRAAFPDARVYVSRNVGRDIGGHFQVLNNVRLEDYRLFCLVHTKKSPHMSKGEVQLWRRKLLEPLLGTPERARDNIQAMLDDDGIGIIGAERCRYTELNDNAENYYALLDRLDIPKAKRDVEFLSGTMMMLRREVLERIYEASKELPVEAGDALALEEHRDGQWAHSIERVFGNVARSMDYRIEWR